MNPKVIAPVLIGAVVVWRIYTRMRRSFGRQRVRSRQMTARIVILALVALVALVVAGLDAWTLPALLLGGGCGAVLASLGLRYTRFELTAEGRFYTPHAYIGLAVTVLFLGRIAYDFLVLYHGPLPAPGAPGAFALPPENPLTLAVSGAFIAYYLVYYIGVLRRSAQPASAGEELIDTGSQGTRN